MGSRDITYEAGGVEMTGYLADGSDGRRAPGVLVAHEATGLSPLNRRRADDLAAAGYVAFAIDLYGVKDLPLEEARRHGSMLMQTPGLMYARARAGLDVLAAQPNVDASRLAAIGFCQGGITSLELARHRAPIRCAVGFHPGLMRPAGSPDGPIDAAVLMMIGEDDPVVPHTDRLAFAQSMTAAGADWQLHVFGGVGHSYTNPDIGALGWEGFRYDAAAERRSWKMMLDFLEEELA